MAESGAQLFARLGAKESLGDLSLPLFSHIHLGLKPGDIVEFSGSEGTAKSEILLNIAAHCVLPKSWNGKVLPGRNVDVAFISTDFKFDLLRLVTILEAKICNVCGTSPGEEASCDTEYKQLVTACLNRVHVLYSSSSSELVATMQSLKTFVNNHPEVCTLILDNVGAFYWTDRSESSFGRGAEHRQQQWVSALSELVCEYHVVVFAARPLLFMRGKERKGGRWDGAGSYQSGKGSTPGALSAEDYMSKQWQRVVRYRFCLQKSQHHSVTRTGLQEQGQPCELLGTFSAHQTHPPGPEYRFRVQQCGLEFV